jgi:adenylate cyclase
MPHEVPYDIARPRQSWPLGSGLRQVRLASGLVLFAYVTLHLLNHALLNVSIDAAGLVLLAQKAVWQGKAGTILLYGALATHAALGLWALYARRSVGSRASEIWQLLLGLSVPAMLANHMTVTRVAWSLYGLDKGYDAELSALWVAEPAWGWLQMGVLVVAWSHACLGLFFLLRLRRWWPAWQAPLLTAAVMLPTLAILGFAAGGRAVASAMANPAWRVLHLPVTVTGSAPEKSHLALLRNDFLIFYAAAIGTVLAARLLRRVVESRGRRVTIFYPGRRSIRVPAGSSVLDASRRARVAHASVCGGRGRCSTCRVRILWSAAALPAAAAHEQAVLEAIGASGESVRLACQLHPVSDLEVVPLIPPAVAADFILLRAARIPGEERFVAAMFIDLRGSTGLAERRMPFDSVFLLGRFITAATSAVEACGGRPVQFLGDGVLALFALECSPAEGCRQALAAVRAAETAFAELGPLFGQEARMELRYSIGVHCGRAIVGEIGFGRQIAFTALGDTINTAHRLQELAREQDVAAVISEQVYGLADVAAPSLPAMAASLRGRAGPVQVRLWAGYWALPSFAAGVPQGETR